VLRQRPDRRVGAAHLRWISRFILFHDRRHRPQLDDRDVKRFMTHLAGPEHVAASMQNRALSAPLFLYEHVLEQPFERKYAHANRAWQWQFVFPHRRRWAHPRTGETGRRHIHDSFA
jgi:hypothetical protein